MAETLNLKATRTKDILQRMVNEDIIIAVGENKNRSYKLKK